MRDRTQHHQKHHQHHRTQANLISIAVLFIFYLLTPIKTYADQPTPTPTSLEIQRATVGIKGKVLANSDYDVIIPIDTYYKVIFDSTGGSAVSMQFVKENCNAIEPAAPTRANYEFNFWVEKGTYEEFNFTTTPITHDITLKAVWTSTSPSPSSPSDENKPNTDKEDTNSSENTKDTTEDKEDSSDNKDENTETKEEDSDNKDKSSETNGEDSKSSENSDGLSDTSEENTETTETTEATETTEESSDGLINTHTNPSSNHSKTSTPSIETDPDIATNTETTDLLSEIKATVLGVFKTISKSIAIVAKISLIGILIWFIWFVILLNNTLVKIQAPSEDQPDQSKRQSKRQSKSWKTIYITPIKKTIEQTVGDKRTIWSLSLPQNLLDDNEELKVKIPWSVYHRAEDINQANQTELHITITPDQPEPMMIYIITNETKEIKIK
mgnify:CR=1 FL=1